jgi:hypothetical protein
MNTRKYNTDHNPYNDRDRAHDNDNNAGGEKATAPAPTAGLLASTSLAALKTVLNGVDTASVVSRPEHPMLQFKSREADGTWLYGQKRTVVEAGSRWAVDPTSFQRGYVCFNANNKRIGERLLPVDQPMPDIAELPDKGFPWSEQWAVNASASTAPMPAPKWSSRRPPSVAGPSSEYQGYARSQRGRVRRQSHADRETRSTRIRIRSTVAPGIRC